MAHAPQTIHNPVSGERITFHRTAADTDGELLEFELELAPDGRVPGAHVHPEQEERFHVLEGTMRFRLGMRTIVAEAGDTVVVPAGRMHKFSNAGDRWRCAWRPDCRSTSLGRDGRGPALARRPHRDRSEAAAGEANVSACSSITRLKDTNHKRSPAASHPMPRRAGPTGPLAILARLARL